MSLNIEEGDDLDRLRSAFDLDADAVFLDLEDHVPRHKLPIARSNIRTILDEAGDEKTILVRVNRILRPEILDDLEAIVCSGLHGVILPKVEEPSEIVKLDHLL